MSEQELRQRYAEALELNGLLFAGGRFEAAYHALMAAAHIAQGLKDAALLGELRALADGQGRWLDGNAPGHRLSTLSAHARRTEPVFASGARAIEVMLLGIAMERQAEDTRRLITGRE